MGLQASCSAEYTDRDAEKRYFEREYSFGIKAFQKHSNELRDHLHRLQLVRSIEKFSSSWCKFTRTLVMARSDAKRTVNIRVLEQSLNMQKYPTCQWFPIIFTTDFI